MEPSSIVSNRESLVYDPDSLIVQDPQRPYPPYNVNEEGARFTVERYSDRRSPTVTIVTVNLDHIKVLDNHYVSDWTACGIGNDKKLRRVVAGYWHYYYGLTPRGAELIAGNQNLEEIVLCGAKITKKTAELLASNKQLEKLELVYCGHYGVGEDELATILGSDSIKSLRLNESIITKVVAKALAAKKQLEGLILENCTLGFEAVRAIGQSKSLKRLVLQNCVISTSMIDDLKKALPDCTIEFDQRYMDS